MLSTKEKQINYDNRFDVMYYSCGDTSNSYGDEEVDNIVKVKDMDTDEVVGYTILNFTKMSKKQSPHEKELIEAVGDDVYMQMLDKSKNK